MTGFSLWPAALGHPVSGVQEPLPAQAPEVLAADWWEPAGDPVVREAYVLPRVTAESHLDQTPRWHAPLRMLRCLLFRALLRAPEQISDALFGIPTGSCNGKPRTVEGIQARDVALIRSGNRILRLHYLEVIRNACRKAIASLLQLLTGQIQ